MKQRFLLFFALFSGSGLFGAALSCGSTQSTYDFSREPDPRKQGFVLGAGDQIQVHVWRNNDLSTTTIVTPDGTIALPLIGTIRAAGMTTEELKTVILKKLKSFIKDQTMRITVAISEVHSYRFTVSGQVVRPGQFSATHYVTVKEAISMAGGPTRYAKAQETLIIRENAPKKGVRKIPINYPKLIVGDAPEMDLVLLPGDVVYVP